MRLFSISLLISNLVFSNLPAWNSILPESRSVFSISAAQGGDDSESGTIDPVTNSDSYSAIIYNNRNGLPTSEANAIAETEEGFIWIGSYSGLTRYDGNTFERIDSTSGISNVASLYVDDDNRLWIGTNDHGVFMMDKNDLRSWGESEGFQSLNVNNIAADHSGTIYAATACGLYWFDEDLTMHAVEDPRIASKYIERCRVSSDGTLYGITNEDDIFLVRDGELIRYMDSTEHETDGMLYLFPDPDAPGSLYFGCEDSTLYYGSISNTVQITQEIDISPLFGVMSMEEIDGRIWITGRNGIGCLDQNGFRFMEEFPMNNSVGSMMVDYEGNLWFTSTRQGVMKIVPNRFSNLFERYELSERVVNTTCLYEDNLLIGTDTGLIVIDNKNKEVRSSFPIEEARSAGGEDLGIHDLIEMLDGVRIRSIIKDSKGRMWISTWRGCGLLCYDGGVITAYTEEDGLLSSHLRAVAEAYDGSILVANTGGVNVIQDGVVTHSYDAKDGIVNPESLTVAGAPNGDIVLGSDGGGIYIINEDGVRCISTPEGLSSGIVMRVKYDKVRHLFWIVTSNSLSYMDENYEVTTIHKFPYSNNFDLYENDSGEMWVLASNGIYVLPTYDLVANGELNPVHYSMDNGLPFISTSNSYSELTEDGDLYMACNAGVSLVNIRKPLESIIDLKVSVPFVDVDNTRIYPDANGDFHLPSHLHKLTVYSYVFNYSLTNPTVMYQLSGFDTEFTTMARSELTPVDYTNLPGGTYRFVIYLKDSQGKTGKRVSVKIIKEKALYEETLFYVAVSVAAVLLIGTLISLYIRRKTKQMELRNAEEVQQARLVTELKTAGHIQESMLPHEFPPFPDRTELDIYASMDPAREVGGDFYDFFLIDDDHLCVVIADVSGKGIPASLFMMISKVIVQSYAKIGQNAAEILEKTNETLCLNNQVEMFVTIWLGILDLNTGVIKAVNAGHEYPAIMQNGEFSLMNDKHGFVAGALEDIHYKEYEFTMNPGDKLFVYTDGVPEATDKNHKLFGTDRLLEALNTNKEKTPEGILHGVREAIDSFVQDAEQFDDLTMVCLEYKGPSAKDAA